jgi:putative tricarboxylic transport membrane protein
VSRDGYAGLAVLAASLVLFALTLGLKGSPMVPVGPGFYPRIVLGVTALLSLGLVIGDLLSRKKPLGEPPKQHLNYRLVALNFGVFGLYVAALPGLGFRVATFLYVVAANALLARPRGARGWGGAILLGFATMLVTWLVFERELSVLLPRGRWTGF